MNIEKIEAAAKESNRIEFHREFLGRWDIKLKLDPATILQMCEMIREMRGALEFYGDEENWIAPPHMGGPTAVKRAVYMDKGAWARSVLRKWERAVER